MTCRIIDFDLPPYDEGSVAAAFGAGNCIGVEQWFATNPIHVGDCVLIGGVPHRVTAVVVECLDGVVYSEGYPEPTGPHLRHDYLSSPVSVQLWLEPMTPEEYAQCQ